jgi:hypothetical protein
MTAWLVVVSAAHVRRAVELGIVQTNHGKKAGIARMSPGDTVIYYSPTEERGDRTPLKAFTAFGTVAEGEIWQADEGSFRPFRRPVDYAATVRVPLEDVRDLLKLTAGKNWGVQLRRGLLPIDDRDAEILTDRMRVF